MYFRQEPTMADPHRLTVGKTTYVLGTAGSFIRVCPVCGHERFRSESNNPLEHCWNGHGPLEVLTTDNLERYKELWEKVDAKLSSQHNKGDATP
jgi:hypothetical protein